MFDSFPMETREAALNRIRGFFSDQGRRLAEAASLLGGPAAERRVTSLGVRLEAAKTVDRHVHRDLIALHDLLTLQDVGDPDLAESGYFSGLHPSSSEAERLCLLADLFTDLLEDVGICVGHDCPAWANRSLRD